MVVRSLMRQGFNLVPLELEIAITKGLPIISFVGLPDASIRESVLKIKAAILAQGFKLPRAQQTVINLRPASLRKSSEGLDLAVAAGILWATGQIAPPTDSPILYGELSLTGKIFAPQDLDDSLIQISGPLWTGANDLVTSSFVLKELKDLTQPKKQITQKSDTPVFSRPESRTWMWTQTQAEIMAVLCVSRGACLLMGPPGSGKTTFARAVWSCLPEPNRSVTSEILRIGRMFGEDRQWYPLVQPHHSVTEQSMVGGDRDAKPGEVTRAHLGILLLDELLEYDPKVQDALREPIEDGVIRLSRLGRRHTYPARFQLLATTNLCHCGGFSVYREQNRCRCSRGRRQNYVGKLRGPLLDRFTLGVMTEDWKSEKRTVSTAEVLQKVSCAAPINPSDLVLPAEYCFGSERRESHIVKVCRALMAIEHVQAPTAHNWAKAYALAGLPFRRLDQALEE